jgi:hypothetical protein
MAVKKQQSGKEKKAARLTKHVCSKCGNAILSDQLFNTLSIEYPHGNSKSARTWVWAHKARCA